MDATIISILSGGSTSLLLVFLFRGWISERLKQSIQHEYSQKLQIFKTELNTRIQAIQHENQLQQLRTSLFFDHQRNAFSGILAKIAEVNQAWINKWYEFEEGLTGPVPIEAYNELKTIFIRHQLFLDSSCLTAMELIFECYQDSFPHDDGSGAPPKHSDMDAAHENIKYLQPRLAELFRSRIGVTVSGPGEREIGLFGAIRLLNRYHFDEINLPVKGPLKFAHRDDAAGAVVRAEDNFDELISKLKELRAYLRQGHGIFHKAASRSLRYLEMLKAED